MTQHETVRMALSKLGHEGLAQSDNLFKVLFEYAPEAYYLTDARGRFITGNKAAETLSGYRRDEIAGKNFIELKMLPNDQIAKSLKLLAMSTLKKPAGPDEFTLIRKDGRCVFVEVRTYPLSLEGRMVVLGIAHDITQRREAEERLEAEFKGRLRTRDSIIQAISSLIDMRDPYTAGHQKKVADLARAIAVEMKLPPDEVDAIHVASFIHDVGKISVPSEILTKPGPLEDEELQLIREHPTTGYEILRSIDLPERIAQIVYQHHERLDGSGYPRGLAGGDILLEARILSVAETLDAMLSHRPYRPAMTLHKAIEEITLQKGRIFDRRVVEACVSLIDRKKIKLGT
jgi:PAS domain S-box-containing protein/putative nucleotidyltransferase with HDIG domain